MESKTEQGNQSRDEGFRTCRFKLKEGLFERAGETANAGLSAYALEFICNSDKHWESASPAVIGSLFSHIISEAVIENGVQWWRWEKNPGRADYLYPYDWDDQFKAMDGLQACLRRESNRESEVEFPDVYTLIRRLSGCTYTVSELGEENKLIIPNGAALYMFDQSTGPKPGNKEDIFVTAVVLESAGRYMLYEASGFKPIALKLYERLLFAAKEGLKAKFPFHTLSRCYLSWAHFIYLLERISLTLGVDIQIAELWRLYVRYLDKSVPETIEMANENHDEYFRRKCGIHFPHRFSDERNNNTMVYMHRRLGDYYSSPAWDSVLQSGD